MSAATFLATGAVGSHLALIAILDGKLELPRPGSVVRSASWSEGGPALCFIGVDWRWPALLFESLGQLEPLEVAGSPEGAQ